MSIRLLVAVIVTAAFAGPTYAAVVTLPSSQTIPPSGAVPGGTASISLNTRIGEREGAWIVVSGAREVAQSLDSADDVTSLGPLEVEVDFAHFVSFGGKLVPDALLPWDGKPRATEKANQPLYVRVLVPAGAKAGTYRGTITVYADGPGRFHRSRAPASSRSATASRTRRSSTSSGASAAREPSGACSAGRVSSARAPSASNSPATSAVS